MCPCWRHINNVLVPPKYVRLPPYTWTKALSLHSYLDNYWYSLIKLATRNEISNCFTRCHSKRVVINRRGKIWLWRSISTTTSPPKNSLKAKALFFLAVEGYIPGGDSFSYRRDLVWNLSACNLALRRITNIKFNIQHNLGLGHIPNGLFLWV